VTKESSRAGEEEELLLFGTTPEEAEAESGAGTATCFFFPVGLPGLLGGWWWCGCLGGIGGDCCTMVTGARR